MIERKDSIRNGSKHMSVERSRSFDDNDKELHDSQLKRKLNPSLDECNKEMYISGRSEKLNTSTTRIRLVEEERLIEKTIRNWERTIKESESEICDRRKWLQ